MIRRPFLVAAACAASALVVFAALARVTAMTLALERSERAALERATHEENVRIALWRLDATLAELIAAESTRSAARFRAAGETSGLTLPVVRARLEIGGGGLRAAPHLAAPPGWVAELPVPEPPAAVPRQARGNAPAAEPAGAAAALESGTLPPNEEEAAAPASAAVGRQALDEPSVVSPSPRPHEAPRSPGVPVPDSAANVLDYAPTATRDPWEVLQEAPPVIIDRINVGGNESGQQSAYTQSALNTQAFKRRQELGQQSTLVRPADEPPGVEVESAFAPRWLGGGDLVLVRQVRRGDDRLLQATWLDWPALAAHLLGQVEAVVPGSRLEPVTAATGPAADPGRLLALLPARLVPGPMPETAPRDWTPVRLTVAAAWAAALVGLLGLAGLLLGAVTLGRRRADFVSAVTHELRTPLTTFRLYADLLSGGMVPPAEAPAHLGTLKREADRLGHLVDNVLAFSRLERRRPAVHLETVPLGALLARVVPELSERAAQAGLKLSVESPPEHAAAAVQADAACVEQVLLNLVDNACKYAAGATPSTLHLESALTDRHALLALRDHGPGIAPRERRRIFRPFHRPAAQAAGAAPGVGLGLALSRRLARAMRGDLRLAVARDGARFELRLRRG